MTNVLGPSHPISQSPPANLPPSLHSLRLFTPAWLILLTSTTMALITSNTVMVVTGFTMVSSVKAHVLTVLVVCLSHAIPL